MNYPGTRLGPWHLPADRSAVMGILNLTPDSFSDGDRWLDPAACAGHVQAMLAAGADLIDVGAESTRPGAVEVPASVQLERLQPLLELLPEIPVPVSIDTRSAAVAETCLASGVEIINDVSAGRHDPAMPRVAAEHGGVMIAMHMRGTPETMDGLNRYTEPGVDVLTEWRAATRDLIAAGCRAEHLWFDPGLGFAKDVDQCWALIRHLLTAALPDVPVVIGASRKRFLDVHGREATERDSAGSALAAAMALQHPFVFRTHDPAGVAQAVRVAAQLADPSGAPAVEAAA